MQLPESPADLPLFWQSKLFPMQGARWPIRCDRLFSADEVATLRAGLWPRDMDDRWAIWLDPSGVLRCWRSWTQTCVYEAELGLEDDGTAYCGLLNVLDDPSFYHRSHSDAGELERFEGVLTLLLKAW